MRMMFLILNLLTNYKVIWENVSFDIELKENTNQYYDKPIARLYDSNNKLVNSNPYYEKGINYTSLSVVNSNHVKEFKIDYRATFDNYNIKSTQTISFNIVDATAPEFLRIPTIERTLNSKKLTEKEIIENISYKDNYYNNDELTLIIKGLDGVDIKRPGKYELTYELMDPSFNITKQKGYYIIINNSPPKIIYDDLIIHNVNERFDFLDYFKVVDEFDSNYTVSANTFDLNINKIGTYPILVKAVNKDGLMTEVRANIKIVDNIKPNLVIKPFNKLNIYDYDESYLKDIIIEVSDNYDKLTIDDVKISGYVNFNEINTYDLTYTIKDSSNNETSIKVKIIIQDNEKPKIEQINDLKIEVYSQNINWLDYFYIYDNYDDYYDLTIKINDKNVNLNLLGNYFIEIEVIDSSKNKIKMRFDLVILDTIAPEVNLLDEIVIVDFKNQNNSFYKSFFEINDNYDEYINISLNIISNVNYNKVGKYESSFIFKDKSGNETIVYDYIYIIDIISPEINLKINQYTYYINDDIPNLNNFILNYYDNHDSKEELIININESIDYSKIGLYEVSYYIYDKSNNYSEEILYFYVDKRKEVLITGTDIYVYKDEIVNLYDNLTINSNVVKIESFPKVIDTYSPGIKQVLHVAYDERGNYTKFIQKVYVEEKITLSNYKTNIFITITGIIGLISYVIYYKKNIKF